MTDMVIPPAAIEAQAAELYGAIGGAKSRWPDVATSVQAHYRELATLGLEAALPHLRPMLELAGNLGRELGRREAADEIAAALGQCRDLHWTHRELAARIAREIATKEPKAEVCTCRTIALSGWDTVQQVVDPRCPLHAGGPK